MSYAVTTDILRAAWSGEGQMLHSVQWLASLSDEEAASAAGVSLKTYRRWLKNANPPLSVLKLFAVFAGFVPWREWEGWEVHRSRLFPPGYTRNGIAPGDIYKLPFNHQLLRLYRNQNKELDGERGRTPPATAPQVRWPGSVTVSFTDKDVQVEPSSKISSIRQQVQSPGQPGDGESSNAFGNEEKRHVSA